MKRISYRVCFVFLWMLLLTGCGKKAANPVSEAVNSAREHVYRVEELASISPDFNVRGLLKGGERIYAYGYSWEADGSSKIHFYALSMDGTVNGEHEIRLDVNENLQCIVADETGKLYAIRTVYIPDEGENGDSSDAYYLVQMTPDGEKLFEVDLTGIPEIRKQGEENGYFYVENLVRMPDGRLLVWAVGKLFWFQPDGTYAGMQKGTLNDELSGADLLQLSDGRVVGIFHGGEGIQLAQVDFEAGTIGDKNKLPGTSYEYSYCPGIGYDVYLMNSYGMYGYNLGDTEKTQVFSFLDSDLSIYSLREVTGLREGEFLALYDEYNSDMPARVGKFTRIPPEEVKEKQILTLAMPNTSWKVREMVADFNKKNEDFRISILDYASLYSTDQNWDAGREQMNMDIAAGKIPDIILLDESMPIDSYRSKGLFEDLMPYIEEDAELDIREYMPNIIEAFSDDGQLYCLVPSYRIRTLFAKVSDVGKRQGWTVQEARELLASKPEGTTFMGKEITREIVIEYCMGMSSAQFIDEESGKCNFASDAFVQMLEFFATFPETMNQDEMDEQYWNEYEVMWRNGKALTNSILLGDFREYNQIEKVTFGEEITMIGFPTALGVGSTIYPELQLAMSSKSKHKEGVWEFLRLFLTEDYQKKLTYSFPLSIKQMEKQAEEAMKRLTYEDENGNQVEYEESYNLNGVEVTVPPISREKVDALIAQLYAFKQVSKRDENLMNIIKEETAPYFAGEKSAMDVAKIIQSRAQIYVNETR